MTMLYDSHKKLIQVWTTGALDRSIIFSVYSRGPHLS